MMVGQKALLGDNVHYLGLSSLEDGEVVVITLYTSDGKTEATKHPLALKTVRQMATVLDPERWDSSFFGPRGAETAHRLSPLLDLVAIAIEQGRIEQGDHLCIAADYPLSLIPFQSVCLLGRSSVELLSQSRVTSLRDAVSIASKPVHRPMAGLELWAPVDERQQSQKQSTAGHTRDILMRSLDELQTLNVPIEHDTLLGHLGPNLLVHLDAHGYFPRTLRADAFEVAGLLVPQSYKQQIREPSADRVLSAQNLLDAELPLTGGHVSLNACVSGVGIPGRSGDILSLELALRLSGANSVLATHWDTRWEYTSAFYQRFYPKWLTEGQPLGQAWRHAIMELRKDPTFSQVHPENWLSISLFGDWR